jgi:hypothetical protein
LITAISDIKIGGDGDFQVTAIKSLLTIYHSFLVQLHTPSALLLGKEFLVFTGQVVGSALDPVSIRRQIPLFADD